MKIKNSIIVLATVVAVFLSGCSTSLSVSELLHPPKTIGDEAQIQSLIEETAGSDYTMEYPSTGEYRSAIVTYDLNDDGEDEAVAFYNTGGDSPSTHVLIMCLDGDSFVVACDYESGYSDVDCIQFADYDFDGVQEILVGFVTYTANLNELTVFDFDTQKKTAKAIDQTWQYSGFSTGDYDGDGASEIMLLTLSSSETKARATLVDYEKEQLYSLTSCSMDSDVTKFENIRSGSISKTVTAVVADGLVSEGYKTQIIAYDTSTLTLKNFNDDFENSRLISASDFDGDGFLEIPALYSSQLPKNYDGDPAAPMIIWYGFNEEKFNFTQSSRCFVNFEYGYTFSLPKNLIDSSMASLSEDGKEMNIYKLKNSTQGSLILTLKVIGSDKSVKKGFTSVTSDNQYNYTYMIADDTLISDSTVEENFALYDESV